MTLFSTLALAMGASWVSGINLYAAVATLGLLGRYAGLQLPGELTVLTNWWVIGVALGMYVVEFVADKIPLVDSTWDVVHTFIRVPAGAVLAAAAFGAFEPSVQVIAFLIGGGIAFSAHGMKTGARAAINTSPEPVSNITASVAEDAVVFGSIGLAAFFPVAIVILVSLAVLVSLFVIPRTLGAIRKFLRRFRSTPK